MLTWDHFHKWYIMYKYFNKIKSDNHSYKNNYNSLELINQIICEDNTLYYLINRLSTINTKKYNSIVNYYNLNCKINSSVKFTIKDIYNEKNRLYDNSINNNDINEYKNYNYLDYDDEESGYPYENGNSYQPYELSDGMYEQYSVSPSDLNKNIYSHSPVFDHLGYQKINDNDYDEYEDDEECDEEYYLENEEDIPDLEQMFIF